MAMGPTPFGPSQTIVQLYHELAAAGYGPGDLHQVGRAHEFVTLLFGGQMRSCGRPFTCHTVGTASVAHRFGGGMREILAGLLHAAYEFGDFGDHVPAANAARREKVLTVVGPDTEAVLLGFFRFEWTYLIEQAPRMAQLVAGCDEAERAALFVIVCNEIEQLPDMPYASDQSRERVLKRYDACLAIARAIGREDIAQRYDEQYRQVRAAAKPIAGNAGNIVFPYLVPPLSYTKRISARMREFVHHQRKRFT